MTEQKSISKEVGLAGTDLPFDITRALVSKEVIQLNKKGAPASGAEMLFGHDVSPEAVKSLEVWVVSGEMPEIKITETGEEELLQVLQPVYDRAAIEVKRLSSLQNLTPGQSDLLNRYNNIVAYGTSWYAEMEAKKKEQEHAEMVQRNMAEANALVQQAVNLLSGESLDSSANSLDSVKASLVEIASKLGKSLATLLVELKVSNKLFTALTS